MRGQRDMNEKSPWRQMRYDAADLNGKLIINLQEMSHTMRFLYEGKGSQQRILIVLDENGGSITQRELTERLGIQPGSASEVIAKLESAGFISRSPNETDRRTADVALTETGKALAAEARPQRSLRHEQMFSCLTEQEKDSLLLLLEKINQDWEKRYRDAENERGHCHRHHKGPGHQGDGHRKRGR